MDRVYHTMSLNVKSNFKSRLSLELYLRIPSLVSQPTHLKKIYNTHRDSRHVTTSLKWPWKGHGFESRSNSIYVFPVQGFVALVIRDTALILKPLHTGWLVLVRLGVQYHQLTSHSQILRLLHYCEPGTFSGHLTGEGYPGVVRLGQDHADRTAVQVADALGYLAKGCVEGARWRLMTKKGLNTAKFYKYLVYTG